MRRGIAALVALTVVVVGLTAAAQARPKATVTVSLAGWSAGADEDNLLKQVVASFEKSHPGIKVDYSVINGDYATAMTPGLPPTTRPMSSTSTRASRRPGRRRECSSR